MRYVYLAFVYSLLLLEMVSAQQMVPGQNNYTSFYTSSTFQDEEVQLLNPGWEQHPELGKLFPEAPCEDCFELLDKRTESGKYFVKKGTNGSYVYQQSSTDPMHYRDPSGEWKTIYTKLRPAQPGVYAASEQPIPVKINTVEGYTALGPDGKKVIYNQHLTLIYKNASGQEQILGTANWANHTAGDEGVFITDAWPGIDMEIYTIRGLIKTNFWVKQALPQYAGGELIIRDQLQFEGNLALNTDGKSDFSGIMEIKNNTGDVLFYVSQAVAFEQENPETSLEFLHYRVQDQTVDIVVPGALLQKPAHTYPLIIDPLFQGTNAITITGSGYNGLCFTGGCAYNLTVPVPPAIIITDIRWSFNYIANGGCVMNNGAVDFTYSNCRSPNLPGFFWFCNAALPGTCTGSGVSILSHIQSCVPQPQCNTYNMNFTMNFYRCNGSGSGCQNTCIAAATPLSMVVEGRTVELPSVSPTVTICQGQSTNLSGSGNFGVPAYTYTWNPGNLTGNPVTVSPAVTTVYTATITDACGNTASRTTTVNVIPNTNPGFTITPNPVCAGQQVAISGQGNFSNLSYDWTAPGSTVPSLNDTQNWNTIYNNPGTYTVTLNFQNGNCTFPSSQQITVNPQSAPTVSIVANPGNVICAGTNVTFTATPTNGGSNPSYQWQVNGSNVGGNSNTYSSTGLNNGDVVTVILTSNSPCALPPTSTSNAITMTVTPTVTPSVTITANPNGPICAGANVTFTATPTNGGPNPSYQWQVNGSNVGGNSNTYSSTGLNNGDVITVILTSNAPCVSPATATSNTITMVVNPIIIPSVNITANPNGPICAGTNVTFTATPTNGGPNPSYQWQVNGSNVGGNSNTYSTTGLNNGDQVTVILTSNAPCVNPATATSNSITITVNPVVVPSVSISAVPNGPICAGTLVTFTANPTNGGNNPSYQWQVNGSNAGTNSPTFSSSNLNNGDVVTVIITSNATCAQPATATSNAINMVVTPPTTPTITVSAQPNGNVCPGTLITFTAVITNGGSAPVITWLINGLPNGSLGNSFASSGLQNGDQVSAVVLNTDVCASGPVTSNAVAVQFFPPLQLNLTPDLAVCPRDLVTLTATPSGGDPNSYVLNWQPSGTGNSFSFTAVNSITYIATVTDQCGVPVSGTVNVTVHPPPVAAFGYMPLFPSLSNQPVEFTNNSQGGTQWFWGFGDGGTSTDQHPSYTYNNPGTYTILMIASSANNCKDTITADIVIEDDISIFIPNAFTPNLDDKNPDFRPYGQGLKAYSIEIFNRWGEKIFVSNPFHPGWHGKYGNDIEAPLGTYHYRITAVFLNNKEIVYLGHVNLIR